MCVCTPTGVFVLSAGVNNKRTWRRMTRADGMRRTDAVAPASASLAAASVLGEPTAEALAVACGVCGCGRQWIQGEEAVVGEKREEALGSV